VIKRRSVNKHRPASLKTRSFPRSSPPGLAGEQPVTSDVIPIQRNTTKARWLDQSRSNSTSVWASRLVAVLPVVMLPLWKHRACD
jgi:hypothetical protein